MRHKPNMCEKHAKFISEGGSARLGFYDDGKEYPCIGFEGEGDVYDIRLEGHPSYDSVLSIFVDNIKDIDSLKEEFPEVFI